MNFMVPQQVNPIITCCYMYTEDIKGKSLASLPLWNVHTILLAYFFELVKT